MKIALGAKNKLTFVEGKIVLPEDGFEDYEKWRRYMVESFLYATTTQEPWVQLGERYGESNRPMIY
uniref:Uncharacterized protein n=1 Tax=Manihot esculenta TaxID=3983 RepID=A0A2C9VJ29_MANES